MHNDGVNQVIERFEIKAALESILFVASEPVSIEKAAEAIEADKADIREIMLELADDYEKAGGGLKLIEVGGGFRMCTRPNCARYVERYLNPPPAQGISRAALEVLAIIAYRQPITKAEVDAIRGVKSDRSVTTLVQKKLIKETGRKEAPGRPIIYGTTKDFLICFGLNDLSELPPEEEFKFHG